LGLLLGPAINFRRVKSQLLGHRGQGQQWEVEVSSVSGPGKSDHILSKGEYVAASRNQFFATEERDENVLLLKTDSGDNQAGTMLPADFFQTTNSFQLLKSQLQQVFWGRSVKVV
jgi:hypothetical protein